MRRHGRHGAAPPQDRARSEIAQLAARLLIDGEAEDFGAAKRKAAEALGVHDQRALPDNRDVQAAIVDHQRLFEGEAIAARTRRLRAAALSAMRFFADFEPRLVGPVLHGTPFEHSAVTLHLFSDEAEGVVRWLLQHRIPYRLDEQIRRAGRRDSESYPVLETALGEVDFELVVMPRVRLQNPPLSPLDGAPYRRLDAAGLAALLASPAAGDVYPAALR
ncbi:MAG TPA: hypothetical protein PJ986_19975 [Gammaproteobacteria bacterium]|mgnify:CR=1 FL=1|nr:hypothetical protein [Gammaproteobacteria bacterium]